MPELAEVEFYRRQWNPGIGQSVSQVLLHPDARIFRKIQPDELLSQLTGARLESSAAHGKQLCFKFSGNRLLGLHLGMSGKMLTAAIEIVPSTHEHLVLVMEQVALVFSDFRMFGKVLFHRGKSLPAWMNNLPPQPQECAFDRSRLSSILSRHPRKPLKALLLDQSAFPGVGNWMADEILWRARIHPALTASGLTSYKRKRLFDETKAVCTDALRVIAPNWGTPPDTWLFNHRWKRGGTCPVSGKPLRHETIGGRTTCFSPAIQKSP